MSKIKTNVKCIAVTINAAIEKTSISVIGVLYCSDTSACVILLRCMCERCLGFTAFR